MVDGWLGRAGLAYACICECVAGRIVRMMVKIGILMDRQMHEWIEMDG